MTPLNIPVLAVQVFDPPVALVNAALTALEHPLVLALRLCTTDSSILVSCIWVRHHPVCLPFTDDALGRIGIMTLLLTCLTTNMPQEDAFLHIAMPLLLQSDRNETSPFHHDEQW